MSRTWGQLFETPQTEGSKVDRELAGLDGLLVQRGMIRSSANEKNIFFKRISDQMTLAGGDGVPACHRPGTSLEEYVEDLLRLLVGIPCHQVVLQEALTLSAQARQPRIFHSRSMA